MSTKPAVLPELYTGDKSWDDWIDHFDSVATVNEWDQEYISSKSVQLLKTAFSHIDVTSASVNPISGGTSCTYVNHSLHRSSRQTNHIQPVPFKGPDSVVDS